MARATIPSVPGMFWIHSSAFEAVIDWAKNLANRLRNPGFRSRSMHRAKFVAQELLPGLKGDYKVLVYGEKFYVLHRESRKKGFGASGSGRFRFHDVLPAGLLDYAESVFLGFRVPFNLESGEIIERRWSRWLEHDPINLVATYRDNLKSLRGIYIDCGWRDQYHIHYGTRILSQRLAAAGIRHTYEEFDDNHSDIDYRMNVSLPFLYHALKP